jgi:hypothetical protein
MPVTVPRPIWITKSGSLGTIPELVFFEQDLEVSYDGTTVLTEGIIFSFLSGELPPGIQVVRTGKLQGVPVILDPLEIDESRLYEFTVRARNTQGVVVDRTFNLTITNIFPPVIVPKIRSLGNVFDGAYYEKQLYAIEDNPNAKLKWQLIRGQLPSGITLSESGKLSGYVMPELDTDALIGYDAYDPDDASAKQYYDKDPLDAVGKSRNRGYTFTLQVSDGSNVDSFTYTLFVASKGLFSADQGSWIDESNNRFKGAWNPEVTYAKGDIVRDPDYVYYVASASIDGNIDNDPPYDSGQWSPYEPQKVSITADNDYLRVDYDNRYIPIITTPSRALPTLRQENNFAFKFDAIDFDLDVNPLTEPLVWTISGGEGDSFDQRPSSDPEETGAGVDSKPIKTDLIFTTNGISLAFLIDASIYPSDMIYNVLGISHKDNSGLVTDYVEDVDYELSETKTQISFYTPPPTGRIFVKISMVSAEGRLDPSMQTGHRFDEADFDASASELPPNLQLDDNGWLYGELAPQQEESKTYNFSIQVGRTKTRGTPPIARSYFSVPVQYSLTVLGSLTDRIIWITPYDLGTIVNGSVSELKIEAVSEMGQSVRYSLAKQQPNRIPQSLNLDLLNDGLITGRVTFRHFQMDTDNTTFDRDRTQFDTEYEFTVKAETTTIRKVYKTSPSKTIVNTNGDFVTPNRIYISYSGTQSLVGKEISGLGILPSTIITEQMLKTDDGGTSFYTEIKISSMLASDLEANDRVYILDGVVSSTKTFKVRLDVVHSEPYENLYFKAFPTLSQRQNVQDLLNDQEIFPNDLIYRSTDPWFGKSKNFKFLALAGINASKVGDYIDAIERNHRWKQINFGDIKTAVAVDEFYNVKYEVVYVDVIDPTNLSDVSVSPEVQLEGEPYIDEEGLEHSVIYPNTFGNMSQNIINSLGYRARGVFPDWMTSVQPDKSVLGFKRAIVLAYTIPGASKLIAYRLKERGFAFNDIEFTIDRYQLDNSLSRYFDIDRRRFLPSKETTFDRLVLGPGELDGGIVDYAVTQSFDSINGRTVDYIKANGGIDGIRGFADGDLLVFAKQENYENEHGPYNGWIDYQNLYFGDIVDDDTDLEQVSNPDDEYEFDGKYGFDSYRVIPSFKNRSLTIEKHLLRSTATMGSTTLEIPYVLGAVYEGKSIEAEGIPANTVIESQAIIDLDLSPTSSDLVTVLTISNATTKEINVGSMVTLRSSIVAAADGSGNTIEVESLPVGPIIGIRLYGQGIPSETYVTEVNGNVLTTNNTISGINSGDIIGYQVLNQRGGIWQVKISDDDMVRLEFVKEIEIGQKVKVLGGYSNGFTFMVYDAASSTKATLPAYRRWSEQVQTSGNTTVFDGNGTRFFVNRDQYIKPEADDKYLKFPQIGVFT